MERWTSEPQLSQNALPLDSRDVCISNENAANASASASGMAGNETTGAAQRADRDDEPRSVASTRVKRAVERLLRPLDQSQLPRESSVFSDSHDSALSRLVELEIIPRLMLLHGSSSPGRSLAAPPAAFNLGVVHVETLARLAAEGDAGAAGAFVRTLLDAGATLEQIYLDLLGPAAKHLGTKWEDDVYDFSVVTIALWRLQQVVYEQGSRLQPTWSPPGSGQRALLSASPGSVHTLGLTILADFFTRAGWDVQHEVSTSWQILNDTVSGEWFDMVGISVAKAADVLDLAFAIKTLRQQSVNPRLLVMVGGPASTLVTDLAQVSGADLTARDAAGAVELAHHWLGIDVTLR